MAINKVVYSGETLIDLTSDTVTADKLSKGITAHDKTGAIITGVLEAASGGGGLPTGIAAFDFGDVVVNSDFTTSRQTFNHKLGVVPDFVMVYAPANVATTYSMLLAMRGSFLGYRSSAYNNYMAYHGNNSTTTVSLTNSNSTTYGVSNLTASSFQLASASSSYYWRKGTYKYIAIKFA